MYRDKSLRQGEDGQMMGLQDVMPGVAAVLPEKTGWDYPVFTDFETLCRPHIDPLKAVLEGSRYRYRVEYADAVLYFYHGCLMTQVYFQEKLFVMPPLRVTEQGLPFLEGLSKHKAHWLEEFAQLPKNILLFYAALMNGLVNHQPIQYRYEDPETGEITWSPLPEPVLSLFQSARAIA